MSQVSLNNVNPKALLPINKWFQMEQQNGFEWTDICQSTLDFKFLKDNLEKEIVDKAIEKLVVRSIPSNLENAKTNNTAMLYLDTDNGYVPIARYYVDRHEDGSGDIVLEWHHKDVKFNGIYPLMVNFKLQYKMGISRILDDHEIPYMVEELLVYNGKTLEQNVKDSLF